MSHRACRIARHAAVAVAAVLGAQVASANGVAGIRAVKAPTVITQPGSYVVTRNISSAGSGPAIVIASSNVTLHLAGHTLSGPGGKQGTGILVDGASAVNVLGGAITRFGTGVEVRGSTNVRVEGLHIDGEDAGGPPPGEVGIMVVNSRAVFLEKNVVTDTFLKFFIRGGGSGGNRIAENTLTGGSAGQIGICYNPDGSGDPAGPSGDTVYNNLVSRFNVGLQTNTDIGGNIFRENDIAYFQTDIEEVTPGLNVFDGNTTIQIAP